MTNAQVHQVHWQSASAAHQCQNPIRFQDSTIEHIKTMTLMFGNSICPSEYHQSYFKMWKEILRYLNCDVVHYDGSSRASVIHWSQCTVLQPHNQIHLKQIEKLKIFNLNGTLIVMKSVEKHNTQSNMNCALADMKMPEMHNLHSLG